jgi:hypothetical protein
MHVMKKKENNARDLAEEEERENQFKRLEQETIRNKSIRRRSSN